MKSATISKSTSKDNPELPCTASLQIENESEIHTVEKSFETSPAVSRYGRTHKPKISKDFLPTDKKVGAILGLSPKSRLSLPRATSRTSSSPNKAVEKGRIIQELFKEERKTKRGRKPNLKLSNSSHIEKKIEEKGSESLGVKSLEVKSEVSTSEKTKYTHQSEKNVEKNGTIKKEEGDFDNEIMSPDVTSSVDDNILSESHLDGTPAQSNKLSACGWVPGDLAWARVGRHPFWPCMVAIDPCTAGYTKIKRVGRGLSSVQRSLHVQFFGDNGRHSWVSTNCVIKFEGKEGLQNFAEKVLGEIKKKDKKVSSAFDIRASSKVKWDCAVQEAEEAFLKTNQERIQYFEENFPPEVSDDDRAKKDDASVDEGDKKQSRTFKRKRSSIAGDEKPRKQIKTDPEISSVKIKDEKDIREDFVNIQTERQKRRKKREKKEPYDFRIFADKYSKHAPEIHPGLTEENLKKLMVRMWSAMDESEKAVYKREQGDSSDESSSMEEDTSDSDYRIENDNDNSSDSTRESTPSIIFAGAPLKKASGLFRGTRQEKVCQICWKPGNTVKCKGPCLGVFHVECLKFPISKPECPETEVKKKGRRPKSLKNENIGNESGEDIMNENSMDMESETEKHTNDEEKEKYISDKENKSAEESENGEFRCRDCTENRTPLCFICGSEKDPKTDSDVRTRCINGHCGKFYHLECVKAWPQALTHVGSSKKQMNGNKNVSATEGPVSQVLTCPQHVCHTCASDDPRNATMRFNHERLVRCILCPTTYHSGNYCVPAGSDILTASQIICPRHYEPPIKGNHHVNAPWCFICPKVGGSLICCDLCPTSLHAECLRIAPPEGGYICEDCDTGRYPLYGEVVWVKLGAYRWWPAQILFPNQVPDNIENLPHKRGEFAVRFFGSHDHYWVNRGRVFLYQEGDGGHKSAKKTSVDGLFQKALTEAAEVHKRIRVDRSLREAEARPGMKPPSYVRIKANKPVGNVRVYEADPSSMTPCECDPESKNPCGVDSDCLNRILMVECTPGVCGAGDRCGNQCFVKRQYPPLEPFRTESRGWGLRALKNLHKGEFVIEYVGEMIDEAEYRRRLDCKHREKDENYYFLTIDNHRLLDAGPKGNVARFMNHSCQPNCETQKWTVNGDTRVGLFALQDIPKGEELTFNYNLECVGPDKKTCMCGAPNCSGYIGVKASKLIEEDSKTKLGRQDNQKSAKRKKKRQYTKLTEAECFECGGGGELLLCDNKTCPKGFHLSCAKRKIWPKGKWLCPWHYCDICQRRTGKRCGFCPRSYCIQHANGNIRLNSSLGMVCRKHDEDLDQKTFSSAYNELLEDVKICLKGISAIEDKVDIEEKTVSKANDTSDVQENTTPKVIMEDSLEHNKLIVKPDHSFDDSIVNSPDVSGTFHDNNFKQESSSLLSNSNMPIKKKRGRPKKYPLSPPTLARYVNPKLPIRNEIKMPDFVPQVENVIVIKKKRGRKKKNPVPESDSTGNLPINTVVQPHIQDQKFQDDVELQPENIPHSPVKDGITLHNASNSVLPRTSNRKRQPSEKLAAFIKSQNKSHKKRKNKILDQSNPTNDLEKNNSIKCSNSSDLIKSDKKLSDLNVASSSNPIEKVKKKLGRPRKVLVNVLEKNDVSESNKNSVLKPEKKNYGTTEKSNVMKSIKDTKPAKSTKKSNKIYPPNLEKVLAVKSDKNYVLPDKKKTNKTTKIILTPKDAKDIQPVLKSYMKKIPKKTILQRIDHKPEIGKFSLDSHRKVMPANFTEKRFMPRENVLATIANSSKRVIDVRQNLYQKSGINGMSDIGVNNSILESFDDNESQYFNESMTTIPIKFSEFGQMNDEFIIENHSPNEELIETRAVVDSEFITPRSEETTEKLSEDGKYQILTNMRPDSLEIDKQVVMDIES